MKKKGLFLRGPVPEAIPTLAGAVHPMRMVWPHEIVIPACVLGNKKPFRTKSDSGNAFICANRAKRPFSASALNALIAASFCRNRVNLRNGEIGFDFRRFKYFTAVSECSDFDNRHVKNCISSAPSVSVHANMIERNNGEDRFNGQPIFSPAPSLTHATFKPKRHNAKYCPFSIRERIVNALAAGDPKRRIARALRVSNNTVTAVAEQEWQQVETRKARIAAQAERAATSAFDRINQKLDSHDDIPLNVLVPVAGVSVDKMIALRGDPSIVARIEHVPGGNIFQAYAELLAAIKARPAPQQLPKAEIKVLPTPQEPKDDECKAPSSSSQAGPSSSSATTQALKDNCPHQTHPRHPQNKR